MDYVSVSLCLFHFSLSLRISGSLSFTFLHSSLYLSPSLCLFLSINNIYSLRTLFSCPSFSLTIFGSIFSRSYTLLYLFLCQSVCFSLSLLISVTYAFTLLEHSSLVCLDLSLSYNLCLPLYYSLLLSVPRSHNLSLPLFHSLLCISLSIYMSLSLSVNISDMFYSLRTLFSCLSLYLTISGSLSFSLSLTLFSVALSLSLSYSLTLFYLRFSLSLS